MRLLPKQNTKKPLECININYKLYENISLMISRSLLISDSVEKQTFFFIPSMPNYIIASLLVSYSLTEKDLHDHKHK